MQVSLRWWYWRFCRQGVIYVVYREIRKGYGHLLNGDLMGGTASVPPGAIGHAVMHDPEQPWQEGP